MTTVTLSPLSTDKSSLVVNIVLNRVFRQWHKDLVNLRDAAYANCSFSVRLLGSTNESVLQIAKQIRRAFMLPYGAIAYHNVARFTSVI